MSNLEDWPQKLEAFRQRLRSLAQMKLDHRLQGKIDLSGVVQETLFIGAQQEKELQRLAEVDLWRWLSRKLAHRLIDECRRFRASMRDIDREVSLDEAAATSSRNLERWLAAEDEPTPSQKAMENERDACIAAALAQLPPDQGEAIIAQRFHGLSLNEIGQKMGRSPTAVAGLLKRGAATLKKLLEKEKDL